MSSNMIYKHQSIDKDDGFVLPKEQFIHDDWRVSNYKESFHCSTAYGYRARGRGWTMGVQKRCWMASPRGILVDGYNNAGKSDE